MEDWQYRPAADFGLPTGRRLRSVKRESGLLSTLVRHGWWAAIWTYLKSVHRLSIRGRGNLPGRPPFVLVANHASHLDALAMACALPARMREQALPVSAGDAFFTSPPLAAFSALVLNALPMWRVNCGRHALADLRERLVEGPSIYILFPEGKRSRDGRMNPFKAGIGMLVAGTQVPVVPCYLFGAFDALPPNRHWPRMRKISLSIAPPLSFGDVSNDRTGWKRIAGQLRDRVTALAAGSE